MKRCAVPGGDTTVDEVPLGQSAGMCFAWWAPVRTWSIKAHKPTDAPGSPASFHDHSDDRLA